MLSVYAGLDASKNLSGSQSINPHAEYPIISSNMISITTYAYFLYIADRASYQKYLILLLLLLSQLLL